MSCPRARCSSSRPREARALSRWRRSSVRSRWGGAPLSGAGCAPCHGADGRGVPAASTRLGVPPADLRDCKTSTAEPEDRWIGIVTQGGAAFGLSLDMPAFGEAATREQIRAVVSYARSLCGEAGWSPGELNFPRAFLVEKAYPENEVVLTSHGREQQAIYERRVGKRWQLEGALRTVLDSLERPFGGATAAAKYNAWYDGERSEEHTSELQSLAYLVCRLLL